ncbi:MAG: hypothetical protein SGJ03_15740 [Alphaproteobacteria bacterium]|nr:hypothetical protein [Alphaproteobacteria bacterium]
MLTGNDIAVLLGFLAAAITLAGFAGIVTSVDRSTAQATSVVIAFRIRNMVLAAFYMAFLSLLPITIDAFEIFPSTVWQFCCMAAAIGIAWMIFTVFSQRMRMTRTSSQGFSLSLFVTLQLIAYTAIALDLAAAAGIIVVKGAFFASLCQLLFVMLSLFYRMILVVDQAAQAKSEDAN